MKTLLVSFTPLGKLQLRQVPDSALLTGGRPLFMPEGSDSASLRLMPAVRVCRLGLAVDRRFARRYYDACTIVALRLPADGSPVQDTDLVADSALTVGEWTVFPDSGVWNIEWGEGDCSTWNISDSFDQAVCAVSQRSTLKTGDIIALDHIGDTRDANIDTRAVAALNGTRVLNFKIK